MQLVTTLTGSFPPISDERSISEESVIASIQRTVEEQIACEVDLLVDGQVRGDIVGIFARRLGLQGESLQYQITGQPVIKDNKSITLPDLELAAEAAQGRPLKAHITGPTVIAESCRVTPAQTPDIYQGEEGLRRLVLDIANALTQEVRWLGQQAASLNIRYLQIDEPSLTKRDDLSLTAEGIKIIVDAWRQETNDLPVILHVCFDVGDVLDTLLAMPVDILNVEDRFLGKVGPAGLRRIQASSKKLALGLVPVHGSVPGADQIAWQLRAALDRYGEEQVWGVTPICGLRLNSITDAVKRMQCLIEAARLVQGIS